VAAATVENVDNPPPPHKVVANSVAYTGAACRLVFKILRRKLGVLGRGHKVNDNHVRVCYIQWTSHIGNPTNVSRGGGVPIIESTA